jgi:beta-ureidopropionase / N-carbamoyl-L-amino-acid hydrolase
MIALDQLNALPADEFIAKLGSIFEHSPWVAERVAPLRPHASLRALHAAMCAAVHRADPDLQMTLIRAHPELAGRAAIRGELTAESTREQQGAGLAACTPVQYARLQQLNSLYHERFRFPFILAVKGHTPHSVIAMLEQRVAHSVSEEQQVALEQICRIARFRLAELVEEPAGPQIIDMAEELATLTEAPGLTCTYLTPVHQATAQRIRDFMLMAGLQVRIDAVGNVIGTLPAATDAPRLLTGSHYDTVIDGGMFDGRLGFLLPIVVAGRLRRAGRTLPCVLEIIAFAEEEGVRFRSTFLGSRALAGQFGTELLALTDSNGITLATAIESAGHDPAAIAGLARDPATMAGFVEVHIEQGPVLLDEQLAVGVVTAIAGCTRWSVQLTGEAGHAGTVPMHLRRDAAAGAAEFVLAVEARCSVETDLVGTVGRLEVPGGAINVIPGRCELTLDLRSGSDARRKAALADLQRELARIASRRKLQLVQRMLHDVASVPCDTAMQAALDAAVQRTTARPARRLPSGAGHDAMMMASITPVGMLFVRCGNGGISHNPRETLTADDSEVAAQIFEDFLLHFSSRTPS